MKTKVLLGLLTAWTLGAAAVQAQVTVTTVVNSGLAEPLAIAVDADNTYYVTDSANNRIARIDPNTLGVTTLAGTGISGTNDGAAFLANFNSPWGLVQTTWGGTNGLVVADYGNHTIRFISLADGQVVTLAGSPGVPGGATNSTGSAIRFNAPAGLATDGAGLIFIADSKNNMVRVMNLNDPALGVTNIVISGTTLFGPASITLVNSTQFWVADTRNHTIKRIDLTTPSTGVVSTYLGANGLAGSTDNLAGVSARFNNPRGLLWFGTTAGLLIADSGNNSLRRATNYATYGATNFSVALFAGTNGASGNVDGSAFSARFNGPVGLSRDALGGVVIADRANNSIRRIQFSPVQPAVPDPKIGRIELVADEITGALVAKIFPISGTETYNNDVVLGIATTSGTETFFTGGPSPSSPLEDTIPAPSPTTGQTAPTFIDGQADLPTSLLTLIGRTPDMTVKARGFATERQPSAVVQARVVFKVANPTISGNNPASFTVSNSTANAELWYTVDGTAPTNTAPSIGPISPGTELSLPYKTNFIFSVRAFKSGYFPSSVITNIFTTNNILANKMTLGFETGTASSEYVGAAGQRFIAPVTMTLLPGQKIYSMQFNLTAEATNGSPAVPSGGVGYKSLLFYPIPGTTPQIFTNIAPAMFTGLGSVVVTNIVGTNEFILTNTIPVMTNMVFTNASINLLGVGYFEFFGFSFLYPSTAQDLLKYSFAHNQLFLEENFKVVVGAFGFDIPTSAAPGDQYLITVGRPSATGGADGQRNVFIEPVSSGSTGAGTLNAAKIVTVGQRKYLVGDVAPFRWYNAGDFGNTNLINDDVFNVFQIFSYLQFIPPANSDFFDSMDSSDNTLPNALDGDDTFINGIAFGDGVLGLDDIYVTFRRSLDPSLTNWVRFWPNDGSLTRQAEVFSGSVYGNRSAARATQSGPLAVGNSTDAPFVTFVPNDVITGAGQTVDIPIYARVLGKYPIRVMAFNLNVSPADGSPALTTAIQFTPSASLGAPTLQSSQGLGNYSAAWLNTSVSGIWGTNIIGTLRVTLPPGANAESAYVISFEKISGSPNGLGILPQATQNGLVTTASRSASSWGDGIPDSWRLRYFGSLNNVLSAGSADADGDGVNNYKEFGAGTNPNDASSVLGLKKPQSSGGSVTLRWPTVSGVTYVVESAPSLQGPWTVVSPAIGGTGNEASFTCSTGGQTLFFRVRVQ